MTLLVVRELTRHYRLAGKVFGRAGSVRALNGVSFELAKRQTLGVVGESGCGKTTLARQLTLIEAPSSGDILLDGVNLITAGKEQLRLARPKVQMVFQNPYASLNPRKKIVDIVAEPLLINTRLTPAQRLEQVRAMLARVGLQREHLYRYPHMLSGGQRQRVAIARALILNPKVVVADEPLSALDVSIQAQISNLLLDLQDEYGVSYVLISHNLAVIEHIADNVLVMYLGKSVESGEKRRIFARPLHPYTQALLASTPSLGTGEKRGVVRLRGEVASALALPPGCAFNARCPFAVERCRIEVPELRPVQGRLVACHRAEST
jgi:dipeptide transport system ATP-binding protein